MTGTLLVQQVIFGITIGSMYALVGLGFTMIFRAMELINFAHGELAMLGAFVALTLTTVVRLPYIVGFLGAVVCGTLVGMLLERTIYRSLKHGPPTDLMIAFVAVSIILKQVAVVIWGAEGQSFPSVFGDKPVHVGKLVFIPQDVWTVVFALIIMGLLLVFFQSRTGRSMQAIAQDHETAWLMGINVPLMQNLTFGISSALGAAAGVLFAPQAVVFFNMGEMLLVKGFTAAILGGMGNVPGAVLGGFLFGVIEQIAAVSISSLYRDVVSFGILILFVLVKPTGLLGRKTIVKV